MAEMRFTIKGAREVFQHFNAKNKKFFSAVAKNWALGAQLLIAKIVREQFSGRPGLKRKSGNAARALQSRTRREGFDVVQRIFINPSNPARIYIPNHDKSGRRKVLRPTNKPYMTFRADDGRFIRTKRVVLVKRTDIVGSFKREGRAFRAAGINEALKVYR